MIGVISAEISIYGVLEKIHNKYPTTMIYLYYSNNYKDGIKELKKKNCKIIITPEKVENDNNSNIIFLSIKPLIKENAYYMDDEKLLEKIDQGNEEAIHKILEKKEIQEDTIILNNPKLLFIKRIIEDIFKEKTILDNTDILIEKIDENKSVLKESKDATIKVIIEDNR